MSAISELAQSFEEQSKRQASDTEQAIRNELRQHEERLRSALSDGRQRIERDIHQTEQALSGHQNRLRRAMLVAWLLPIATMLVVQCALLAALWWTGSQVASNAKEMRQVRAAGVEVTRVGQQDVLILPSGATATQRETRDGRTAIIIER